MFFNPFRGVFLQTQRQKITGPPSLTASAGKLELARHSHEVTAAGPRSFYCYTAPVSKSKENTFKNKHILLMGYG